MKLIRVAVIAVVCGGSAIIGFTLSKPDWLGVEIAAASGILYAMIAIWAFKDKSRLSGLAVAPVIFGTLIRRQLRETKLEGLAEYGVAFQFAGIAFTVGMVVIGTYLIFQRRKRANQPVETTRGLGP